MRQLVRVAMTLAASTLTLAACGGTVAGSTPSLSTSPTTTSADEGLLMHAALTECTDWIRTIQTALEASYALHGHYASTLGELVRDGFLTANASIDRTTGPGFTARSGTIEYVIALLVPMGDQPVTATGAIDGRACPR